MSDIVDYEKINRDIDEQYLGKMRTVIVVALVGIILTIFAVFFLVKEGTSPLEGEILATSTEGIVIDEGYVNTVGSSAYNASLIATILMFEEVGLATVERNSNGDIVSVVLHRAVIEEEE